MSLFNKKIRIVAFLLFTAVVSLFYPGIKAETHAARLNVLINGGPRISRQVMSLREARYKNVIPQSVDFSCGAAAMATLLKYVYGKDVTEDDIVKQMLKNADKNLIKKKGFSLLDMKKYALSIGFRSNGYKIEPEQLTRLKIPTIVLITVRGYSHFVILKGIIGDKVYTADPAWGNRVIELEDFLKAWNNVMLIVVGPKVGTPVGLAPTDGNPVAPKGQALILKDRILDAFVMDPSSRTVLRTTGGF